MGREESSTFSWKVEEIKELSLICNLLEFSLGGFLFLTSHMPLTLCFHKQKKKKTITFTPKSTDGIICQPRPGVWAQREIIVKNRSNYIESNEELEFVDYTEQYSKHLNSDVICATGKGKLFFALIKLKEPFKRFDGKMAHYELRSFSLSKKCKDSDDQAWACVDYDDFTYWTPKEIKETGALESTNLFKNFRNF